MNQLLRVYQVCEKLPFGEIIFSKMVCFKAPYFASIKPRFMQLRPGYCEVQLKKRRSVTNHLKSVHAIAMCNVSELTAGSMLEASIPKNLRWIPKGMTVSYLKMAKTDLKATCEISTDTLATAQELPMTVHVTDTHGVEVFRAVINMYISKK
jgi:acyl-coenzyme A thioesterase PaaI-like protein